MATQQEELNDLIIRLGKAYRRVGRLEAALEVAIHYLSEGAPAIPSDVLENLSLIAIEEAPELK